MPRKSRNLPAGCVVHIFNRGNDKRPLLQCSKEFEEFLELVAWAKAICPVRIVAYCIMSNHWHFVFWVEIEWDVSAFLHRLTSTHAKRWRQKTRTIGGGHVYGDRFKNSQIYSEQQYFRCIRYVEQNPLKAGLVHRARDWKWSSLSERLGNGRGLLDQDPVGLPLGWTDSVDQLMPDSETEEIHRSLRRY